MQESKHSYAENPPLVKVIMKGKIGTGTVPAMGLYLISAGESTAYMLYNNQYHHQSTNNYFPSLHNLSRERCCALLVVGGTKTQSYPLLEEQWVT